MFSKIKNILNKRKYELVTENCLTDTKEEKYWKKLFTPVRKELDGKLMYGLVDSNGDFTIPSIYDKVDQVYKDRVIAIKDGKYGLVNTKNEIIVDFVYRHIRRNDDHYTVENNERLDGLLDMDGNRVLPNIYKHIFVSRPEIKRLLAENTDGFYALFDYDAKQITEHKYDKIKQQWSWEHSNFGVSIDGKFGVINGSGETVLPFEYLDIVYIIDDALINVRMSPRKCGLYNVKKGCVVVEYTELLPWGYMTEEYGKIFSVKKNGKWGAISEHGEIIMPFEYLTLNPFTCDGVVVAENKDRKFGEIDYKNNIVTPFIYDDYAKCLEKNNDYVSE